MDDIYTLSDTQLSKRIGEKLKAIRLKRNITQQSLAEASSISLSSVKKVENGEIGSFALAPPGHGIWVHPADLFKIMEQERTYCNPNLSIDGILRGAIE